MANRIEFKSAGAVRKNRTRKADVITEFANSLTSEQYIALLNVAYPITAAERAELDRMSNDDLLRELNA